MAAKLINAALLYDFDGTLSPINMQEHDFIPSLGMNKTAFWTKVKDLARSQDACEILCYMHVMLAEANHKNIPVSREIIKRYGKDIALYPGVEEWFGRINKYARRLGIRLEHYVISSGVKPLVEGSSIGKHFKRIFACEFIYDADGKPIGPGVSVDYTSKTQYIFRINKGCLDQFDDGMINKFVPMHERPVPLENMIFIGDGETDIPAMKMTSHYGGLAIAVHKPNSGKKKQLVQQLVEHNRAQCFAPADYRKDKALERLVLRKLDEIASAAKLKAILQKHS